MLELNQLINPFDIVIGVLFFLAGRVLKDKNRGISLFLQVSILLLRITKHYFDTHPEAAKIANKYRHEVDTLYHKHTVKKTASPLG